MSLTDLHRQILIRAVDDYIGLWVVIWHTIGGAYPMKEPLPEGVREKVITMLRDLLQSGLIQPLLFSAESDAFETLPFTVVETIDYIEREWDSLDHNPSLGDVIWFKATEVGKQLAQEILASQNDNASAN